MSLLIKISFTELSLMLSIAALAGGIVGYLILHNNPKIRERLDADVNKIGNAKL